VAEKHRTPGAEEVQVTIAIGVEEIGTLGVRHEGRFAAYRAEGTDGRVDASGEKSFGTKLQVAGAGEVATHASSIGGDSVRFWTTKIASGQREWIGRDMSQIIRNKLL
jgi:hypothetical protein